MEPTEAMLGFHASISGGVDKAVERIQKLDCPAGQIFLSNNRQWAIRDLKDGEEESFKETSDKLFGDIVAHACYLINLAKDDQDAWEKSVRTLRKETKRADVLGVKSLVLHPGSHVGNGVQDGIKRIGEALNKVIDDTPEAETNILLETMAGQGTSLGHKLEQLARMYEKVEEQERIEFCLDTCHMHAGGYDLRDESAYEKTMQSVENILGLEKVTVLHLNDSKKDFDSRVDRHENIAEGSIGEECFRCLMNDTRWDGIPKILETPVEDDWKNDYGKNIDRLLSLIDS